jgi:peptide/nickel transport system permease protein
MGRYIIRRLVVAMPSLVIVTVLIAGLLRLQPGDVVMARLSESGYLTQEDVDKMRADLGLDKSFPVQYAEWVGGLLQGNLGVSLWTGRDVLTTLVTRSRVSIQLALMAMIVAVLTAIPLGIVSAVRQDSWLDYVARMFSITGLSVPDFFLATMLLYVLSVWVGWLPDFGYTPPWEDPWANIQAFIFPSLIVGYRFSAISARMTRSAMLEVLRQDYVRTAWAKGLRERMVVLRHAVKNAMIPVLSAIGLAVPLLVGGSVIIENIFNLPGMGQLMLVALQDRDYPVVSGVNLFFGTGVLVINLLIDLLYVSVDPRVRYQ